MSNLTDALIAAKLMGSGGSGGGGGLPPIESSTTTILAEQSLAFEDQGGTWESVVADVTTPLVVGANYTVDWDGTSYDCVAFNLHGLYAVGNAAIAGETDTGEPFLVYVIEETGLIINANDTSATHTFGLAQKTQDPANGTALSVQGNAWVASGSVLPPIINIMVEIVPSGTLSFSPSNDLYMSIVSFTPVNDSSYVVAWDDTDYEVTARYDEDYGVFVGNLSIMDETADTGEPFVIVSHNGTFYIVTKNSAATHVVAISGYTQSPPDNYVLSVDGGEWKAMPNEGGALICHVNNDTGEFDVTWQQIFDALSQGKRVMSVYTNNNSAAQIVLYIAKKNSNSYDIYDTTRTSGSTPIASCTSANAHPVYK